MNEAFARKDFGGEPAIGKRFGWGDPPGVSYETEIVGIARNAVYGDLREESTPLIYLPAATARYLLVLAVSACMA